MGISQEVVNLTATDDVVAENGESFQLLRDRKVYSFQISGDEKEYTLPLIFYKGYCAWAEYDTGTKCDLLVKQSENALVKEYSEAGLAGTIYVEYMGTAVQTVSEIVSLFTAVSILAYSLYKIRKWRKRDAY